MFSSEIKETIYIAVSLMILALVLGMVVVVIDIRSDFAEIRNDEIATAIEMREYRKFNKYDNKTITGVDIIELIREFKNEEIEVYVDRLNGGSEFYLTPAMVSIDPSLIDVDTLQPKIRPNHIYTSYLRYDFDNVKSIVSPSTGIGNYATITGISIKYVESK